MCFGKSILQMLSFVMPPLIALQRGVPASTFGTWITRVSRTLKRHSSFAK